MDRFDELLRYEQDAGAVIALIKGLIWTARAVHRLYSKLAPIARAAAVTATLWAVLLLALRTFRRLLTADALEQAMTALFCTIVVAWILASRRAPRPTS